MKKKIIFIGGIHGVGKGSICKQMNSKFSVPHYTASNLLRWEEISSKTNKLVANFESTQQRLLRGIDMKINKNELSLLDGHFCLLNSKGKPQKIEFETFEMISPIAITVVTEKVELIKERLENRDSKIYDINLLEEMQNIEIAYSKEIAFNLKIPHILKVILNRILNFARMRDTLNFENKK